MKRRLGAARLGLTREITAMPAQTFATGPNSKAQENNTLSYEGYTKTTYFMQKDSRKFG